MAAGKLVGKIKKMAPAKAVAPTKTGVKGKLFSGKPAAQKAVKVIKGKTVRAKVGVKTTGSYRGKSNQLGGGGRFQQTVDAIMKKKPAGGLQEAKAIAADQGIKKLGQKQMTKFAVAGKKRVAKKK